MMKMRRNTKGFTLIELLIVVAIIGILAAIAIPAYSGYTTKAKVAGVVHSMGAIKTAVAAYHTEAGTGGAPVDLASAAAIKTTLGIEVSEQYALYAVTAATGVITATIQNVKAAASGGPDTKTIILTPNWTTQQWAWSGSVDAALLPKS